MSAAKGAETMKSAGQKLEEAVEPILAHMERTAAAVAPEDPEGLEQVRDVLARLRAALTETGK